jgi:hypothetical protein
MGAREDVLAQQPTASAVFHEAVTEEGMQCPATWAIYADAEAKDNLGLGSTEDEARESAADRLDKRAVALAAAAEHSLDEEAAQITEYLQEVSQSIWNNWYADVDGAEPATLDIRFEDGTDGYNPDSHTLAQFISDGNRADILGGRDAGFDLFSAPTTWQSWYIVLVHEMIHEYQYRALNDSGNAEGQQLMDNHPKNWPGPGHGPGFYSAIVNRAGYFGVQNIPQFCHIFRVPKIYIALRRSSANATAFAGVL